MMVSVEKVEGASDQSSIAILSLLIGTKIFQFSASVEDYHGIETVNFDRNLWQILTYVSGDVKGTQDFIHAVIAFHHGQTIDLPIMLGEIEPKIAEAIRFVNDK